MSRPPSSLFTVPSPAAGSSRGLFANVMDQPEESDKQESCVSEEGDSTFSQEAKNWGFSLDEIVFQHDEVWKAGACPKCRKQHGSLLACLVHREGLFYCQACGHHGQWNVAPEKYRLADRQLPEGWWRPLSPAEVIERLGANYVNESVIREEVGDGWTVVEDGEGQLNVVPALVWKCYEQREGKKELKNLLFLPQQDGSWMPPIDLIGTAALPWNWPEEAVKKMVLVDHPLDVLALRMNNIEAVCLSPRMGGVNAEGQHDWSMLGLLDQRINQVDRFVFAFRDTEGNHRFEEELSLRFGRERCYRVRWANALNESQLGGDEVASAALVLMACGQERVQEVLEQAKPYPVKGTYELADVESKLDALIELGLQRGYSTTFPSLDEYYTLATKQWTLVHGYPSLGKSTFLDALLLRMADLHDWRVAVFSPENLPLERYYATLMEKRTGATFLNGSPNLSKKEIKEAKDWIGDRFKMIMPDDGQWTLDHILGLAKMMIYRHRVKAIVLDPWNELMHQRDHQTLDDYLSESLGKINRFAAMHDVHVFIVAHPNKVEPSRDGTYPVPVPYQINGGAMWRNKAPNILCLHRNPVSEDHDILDIYIQKVRFKELGRFGHVALRHDDQTGQFYDDIDQSKRKMALKTNRSMSSSEMRVSERKMPSSLGVRLKHDMPEEGW